MKNRLTPFENAFPRRTLPLLMTSLVAGDPYLEATRSYMDAVVDGGADVIELIVPFSDPAYHGPVLRRACRRAMSEKVLWDQVEVLLTDFRDTDDETPVIISSYFNRVLSRGTERCLQGLADAGADGVMITDLPIEEARTIKKEAESREMALIQTVAPTTTKQRFRQIVKEARGLMVWTGHAGGELAIDQAHFEKRVRELRQFTSLPLVASMNIETGTDAARVARSAHGVLVGSSLAWLIEGKGSNVEERLTAFVADLRVHLDAVNE